MSVTRGQIVGGIGGLLLALAAVSWIVSARGRSGFRNACLAIPPGTRIADAAARLQALGAVYVGKVAAEHQWYRAPRWSFKGATCHVVDDAPPNLVAPDPRTPLPDSRVVTVRHSEGIPIL